MRSLRPILPMILLLLAGCAALGLSKPDSVDQKWAAGVGIATAVVESGRVLMNAGKITPDEEQQIIAQALNAKAGLDIAKAMQATDAAAAKTKADGLLFMLTELQKYLAAKNNHAAGGSP